MPVDITFIRHAETTSNAAGRWQGQGDAPLSARGEEQLAELSARMWHRTCDLVISSDLGRAVTSAAAISDRVETDPAWREADIGDWEGLDRDQIAAARPEELAALQRGEDVRMGGGETYPEFAARIEEAFAGLVDRLDDGAQAVVVAHGGVIGTVVRSALGVDRGRSRPTTRIDNTALTTVRVGDDGHRSLVVFNDRTHLNGAAAGRGHVWVIRHGESEGNVDGRWQGVTDGQLTAEGRRQAVRLAEWGVPIDSVYTSPLSRARRTAAAVAASRGVEPVPRREFAEIDFGAWENLTSEEVAATAPDEWRRIAIGGEDLLRGGMGETWTGAAERMRNGVEAVAADGSDVGVVTHGGVTRALVCTVLGLGYPDRHRVALPGNTSMTRLEVGDGGIRLDSYNLTPHLED